MNILAERAVGESRVVAAEADITALDVDVVVNAANERLQHGGGVAAAIARAGGRAVQEESDRWVAEHGPLRTGHAAVTTAGAMPARHVVHVVGPRYRGGQDNAALLRDAVEAALEAAVAVGGTTLAMPAISAGIFGYPPDEAANVIAAAVAAWVETNRSLDVVYLVGYDREMADRFAGAVGQPA